MPEVAVTTLVTLEPAGGSARAGAWIPPNRAPWRLQLLETGPLLSTGLPAWGFPNPEPWKAPPQPLRPRREGSPVSPPLLQPRKLVPISILWVKTPRLIKRVAVCFNRKSV